jgi:hypothetical protein
LKVRDENHDPRSERFCWVSMRVTALPFNKAALIVDDATVRPYMFGPDGEHDALRDRIFDCLRVYTEPGEEIGIYNIFGDNESGFNPRQIPLALLAGYRLVIWNNFFFGTAASGLRANEYEQNVLSPYLAGGGRLYLYGARVIGALAGDNYGYGENGLCPIGDCVASPAWDERSFIWNFLHLTNCVRGPSEDSQRIDGWVGARSAHPLYPDIRLNTAVWDPWEPDPGDGQPIGGFPWFEVYRANDCLPIRSEQGLDTIYVAETFNHQGVTSELDGRPCALRYAPTPEDSALGRSQGRVFLQMFPFFQAHEAQAAEAAGKAVTWLMTGRDE